jgi:hypothetical protein
MEGAGAVLGGVFLTKQMFFLKIVLLINYAHLKKNIGG